MAEFPPEVVLVVMPMGSGKTTTYKKAARSAPLNFMDVDHFRVGSIESVLKKCRRLGRWREHNEIWYPMIVSGFREWYRMREHVLSEGSPHNGYIRQYPWLLVHDAYLPRRWPDEIIVRELLYSVPPLEVCLKRVLSRTGVGRQPEKSKERQYLTELVHSNFDAAFISMLELMHEQNTSALGRSREPLSAIGLNWDEPFAVHKGEWLPRLATPSQLEMYNSVGFAKAAEATKTQRVALYTDVGVVNPSSSRFIGGGEQ